MHYSLGQLSQSVKWVDDEVSDELEGVWKEPVVVSMFWGMTQKHTQKKRQNRWILGTGFDNTGTS
jgi:hypothetical protein